MMEQQEKKEWFEEWFDSPYYHTLYKNHDDNEAKIALDNLLKALSLPPESKILDLACGKGRHSRYLAEKGFDVTGLDISNESIRFARQFEHENLHFYQHDMRQPYRHNYFDAVMNMFTSFGYFDTEADHLKTLKAIAKGLKYNGLFLLDFFNAQWVRQTIIPQDTKTVDGIQFTLRKEIREGHVYKTVEFEAEGKPYRFQERVRLYNLEDFESLFAQSGLKLERYFGGYDLTPFDPQNAKRLILIASRH